MRIPHKSSNDVLRHGFQVRNVSSHFQWTLTPSELSEVVKFGEVFFVSERRQPRNCDDTVGESVAFVCVCF